MKDAEALAALTLKTMTLGELKGVVKKLGWDRESEQAKMPDWYGIPGIKFIYHGSWSDPEVEYEGRLYNACVIEDAMWNQYLEETENVPSDDDFARYMQDHADDVRELCQMEEEVLAA